MIPKSESYALVIDDVVTFKGNAKECHRRRKAFTRKYGMGRARVWHSPDCALGQMLK